jgi:hypothetical protein
MNEYLQGGDYILKVFDMYSTFSLHLFTLLAAHFENLAILKPFTSRPANSERCALAHPFDSPPNPVSPLILFICDGMQIHPLQKPPPERPHRAPHNSAIHPLAYFIQQRQQQRHDFQPRCASAGSDSAV